MQLTLIVGNKNYSSWSLRPWLALRAAGIPFSERVLPIGTPEFRAALAALSLPPRVPVLLDGDVAVWDSLAIIEYAADLFPKAGVWPADRAARALARSASAEMHSSFIHLRRALPMNLWRPPAPYPLGDKVEADVARLAALWGDLRARFGGDGPFLFGAFCAADAMFAPAATRLRTYQVPLDPVSAAYVEAIHTYAPFADWRAAAITEAWLIAEDEVDWPQVKRVGVGDVA